MEQLSKSFLQQKQSLPLEAKIVLTQNRIREFYDTLDGNVYVAFSGGKDSTVLLDIVRKLYPNVPAVFSNTGQDFPEIRKFIRTVPNVTKLKPILPFHEVVETKGWPVISKKIASQIEQLQREDNPEKYQWVPQRWLYLKDAPFKVSGYCCQALKKRPSAMYEKATGRKPFIGIMASDSDQRELAYLNRGGCNSFSRTTASWPLGIWTEKDIWEYLRKYKIPFSNIYDKGYYRTGCMICLFGIYLDCGYRGENRIQTLARTHPKLWSYYIKTTRLQEVMTFLNLPVEPFW